MNILFTKHNVTIHPYLKILGKSNDVVVFHHEQASVPVPENCKECRVVYRPRFVTDVFHKFSISLMYPQYVWNIYAKIEKSFPDSIFISDISHFIFAQTVYYKHRYPDTKLYVWSEARQWPKLWLSRWIMYGFWWYFKRNLKYVEKVFVFSNEGKKFFNTYAPDATVEVFPPAIDTSVFSLDTHKEYLSSGVLRIIMNARYIPLKEHKTLFKAAKILQGTNVKFEISLIGRGGHLESDLKACAQELGISKLIQWLEPVPSSELQSIYSKHDVLVLPSNREAIGMVVPEAMACGLATVTSTAVGANTYVEEGETGFIFETGKAEHLADCLELLTKPGEAQRMGKQAAQEIQKKYTIDVLGERMLCALKAE